MNLNSILFLDLIGSCNFFNFFRRHAANVFESTYNGIVSQFSRLSSFHYVYLVIYMGQL